MSDASAARPLHRRWTTKDRAAALGALLMAGVLLATCASPAPSGAPASPPATAALGTPAAGSPGASPTPGVTPLPSDAPADGRWTGVTLLPIAPVATLEPLHTAAAGVIADTAFRLTPLDGSDPLVMAAGLVAEPAVTFTATTDGAAALVKPATPLRAGGLYRFSLRSADGSTRAAWAVQAVGPLHVARTTPGDITTDVPLNTGIEITFDQDGVGLADAKPYITVTPATPGHLVGDGRTIAFVPDRALKAATLYRVTVRHGLPLAGTSMTLEEDHAFAFETTGAPAQTTRVDFSHQLMQVSPDERAEITVRVDHATDADGNNLGPNPKRLDVAAYRLAGLDAAIAAWRTLRAAPDWGATGTAPINTGTLTRVVHATVPLRRYDPGNDWEQLIRLPARLPAGYYVVTETYLGVTRQMVLESTSLAVYTQVTETRTVAWVNDTLIGGPVDGAGVNLSGASLGTTGADGLLVARTPARITNATPGDDEPLLIVRKGSRSVFVEAGGRLCGVCGETGSSPWWRILSLDRYQYRTTDTVLAWGVLRDRETGSPAASVTIRLVHYDQALAASADLATYTATPDASGAFLVKIPFTDLPMGDYEIRLSAGPNGSTHVASTSFTIARIAKPAWSLAMTTGKHAILVGSKVGVTVTARFFEGTPVAGADIRLATDRNSGRITTDATGTGTTAMRLTWDPENTWEPWTVVGIDGRPSTPEEGAINAGASVALFQATVLPKVAWESTSARVRVSGTVHDVAFARFESPAAGDPSSIDPYGKLRAGATVKVRVVRTTSVAVRTGSGYDFITKRTIPVYDYRETNDDLGTRTLVADAKGRFGLLLPALADNQTYELRIRAYDAQGRYATVTENASAPWTPTANRWMSIMPDVPNPDEQAPVYGIGDPIRLIIDGGMGAAVSARYLWTLAQGGLRDTAITADPKYAGTFSASYVPDMTFNAVRWTGGRYEVASGYTATFRSDDRRLTVKITPDKARYLPGGTTQAAIRVTDAAGHGVAAAVYVRVMDEKLFAMGLATSDDPNGTLYESPGSGILGTGYTHFDPRTDDGGKGDATGGGGDERSDFRDWLAAELVHTDADGRGSVTFTLSVDLTSWRIVGDAISPAYEAGTGQALIPVSLPFFGEVTVAPEYLAADKPVIMARAFGTGLTSTDTVTFTISSDTLPMAPVTRTAAAFTPVSVDLPALTLGTHRLRVEAVTGTGATARHDSLVREFRVVASRTAQAVTTAAPLTGTTPVAVGTGFTTLVLSDGGRGRAVPILESLLGTDPTRADRAFAGALAERILKDRFGIEPVLGLSATDISMFCDGDGVRVLPYSAPDLELTVLAAMTGDSRLPDLRDMFDMYQATTREQELWVLAGRAAIGQTVLAQIRDAAALTDLTVDEQIAVGLAAVAAGDETTARDIEQAVLAADGEQLGSWVRVRGLGNAPDTLLTARLAVIAAAIGDPLAAGMDDYASANPPKATAIDLERALAARGWADRMAPADAKAALVVDGRRSELAVTASEPVTVTLTPAQAATATLTPVSGSVVVTTRIEQPLDPASLKTPRGVTFTREVRPASSIKATDVVQVSLRVTFDKQVAATIQPCWTVTELVPSGLAPIASSAEFEEDPEPGMVDPWRLSGQRLDFCVTPDPIQRTWTLHYAARVVTPGTYAWEPAVLLSGLASGVGIVLTTPDVVIGRVP
ncbi:MAG: Ig-like domain-containing protein [Chloroflexota bacterium]